MDALIKTGRVLFAMAMAFFGMQCLVFASGRAWPVPGPPWTQGHIVLAWLAGAGFIAAALCIAIPWQGRLAANLLGAGILLRALYVHVPQWVRHLHDPGPWTSTFEVLAMCGAVFVIAGTIPVKLTSKSYRQNSVMDLFVTLGFYLFSISLIVFGVQHFKYAHFVGALIPAWIPWHLFWVYATGAVFFVSAASLITGILVRPAAAMLASMFLLWVAVLHAPRVAHAPHNGAEWTSAAVALAMGAAALVMAGALGDRERYFAAQHSLDIEQARL
jgi:uncharacterized membrane protein